MFPALVALLFSLSSASVTLTMVSTVTQLLVAPCTSSSVPTSSYAATVAVFTANGLTITTRLEVPQQTTSSEGCQIDPLRAPRRPIWMQWQREPVSCQDKTITMTVTPTASTLSTITKDGTIMVYMAPSDSISTLLPTSTVLGNMPAVPSTTVNSNTPVSVPVVTITTVPPQPQVVTVITGQVPSSTVAPLVSTVTVQPSKIIVGANSTIQTITQDGQPAIVIQTITVGQPTAPLPSSTTMVQDGQLATVTVGQPSVPIPSTTINPNPQVRTVTLSVPGEPLPEIITITSTPTPTPTRIPTTRVSRRQRLRAWMRKWRNRFLPRSTTTPSCKSEFELKGRETVVKSTAGIEVKRVVVTTTVDRTLYTTRMTTRTVTTVTVRLSPKATKTAPPPTATLKEDEFVADE